jgi:hypothetical protein
LQNFANCLVVQPMNIANNKAHNWTWLWLFSMCYIYVEYGFTEKHNQILYYTFSTLSWTITQKLIFYAFPMKHYMLLSTDDICEEMRRDVFHTHNKNYVTS